ncbi:S66 family peptidase [Priestia taiwanensis]|uniref:LD-carboxypeptidase n=1 Tax=Priestia taiwanensis TaxID=1347902 RepID=A0A917AT45_9BACI|nr:S66 peptidase family protein [Priestia taiwanensis]MBM7364224.1 muramoyltetrapeptide carboxypeptidase LdcA involved in peptidoglycan recycling [Priestia taiwanensis]GGE72659.1 LD-carboxypeptidase [Priestia taiwanensis]
MIIYPSLQKGATIGVTAPSSGVPDVLHGIMRQACERMEQRGYKIHCGETVWTQEKAKAAKATKRAAEWMAMMQDEDIDAIIPPWGGQLLIEILEEIEFEKIEPKWVLGYSDTSVLLLAMTLTTGIATAHGTNLIDLRGEEMDATTAMWEQVLATETGGTITQHSSPYYQREWQHENLSPHVFHLTEETKWKTISGEEVHIEGRLLGGCIDMIRHLIGTSFGRVEEFREKHCPQDSFIWYFENCEMLTTDLRRSLVQMKLAGWFNHCAGILFGRSSANQPIDGYIVEDVYQELMDELHVPIVYDIDCGHVPPQLTLINGAFAEVKVKDKKGVIIQHFRP